jgi:hypothetical protein
VYAAASDPPEIKVPIDVAIICLIIFFFVFFFLDFYFFIFFFFKIGNQFVCKKMSAGNDRNTRVTLKNLRRATLEKNNAIDISVGRDNGNAHCWHSIVLKKDVRAGDVLLREMPLFSVCTAATLLGRREWQGRFIYVGNHAPPEMATDGGVCDENDCQCKDVDTATVSSVTVRDICDGASRSRIYDSVGFDVGRVMTAASDDNRTMESSMESTNENKKSAQNAQSIAKAASASKPPYKTPIDSCELNNLLILEHALRTSDGFRFIADGSWMDDYCIADAGMLNMNKMCEERLDDLINEFFMLLKKNAAAAGKQINFGVLKRNCLHFVSLLRGNCFESSTPLYVTPFGCGFYPVGSYFNHSCAPNAWWTIEDGQALVVRAICDLSSGTEIVIAYDSVWGELRGGAEYHKRKRFGAFECACSLCNSMCLSTTVGAANSNIAERIISPALSKDFIGIGEQDRKRLLVTLIACNSATHQTTIERLPSAKKMAMSLLSMPSWLALCRCNDRQTRVAAIGILTNLYDTLLLTLVTMDSGNVDDLMWLRDYAAALEQTCIVLAEKDDLKVLPAPRCVAAVARLFADASVAYMALALVCAEADRQLALIDDAAERAEQHKVMRNALIAQHREKWQPKKYVPTIVDALCNSVAGIDEIAARKWVHQLIDMAGMVV